MKPSMQKLTMILTGTLLISVIIFCYMTLFDGTIFRKVVSFESLTIKTAKEVYHPGEMVTGYVTFCKYRPIVPEVQWSLVDSYIKFYPSDHRGTAALGCRTAEFDIEPIPKDSYTDTYRLVGTLKYKANPLREVEYVLTTEEFKVIR